MKDNGMSQALIGMGVVRTEHIILVGKSEKRKLV
jgi:hypothetical protein